MSAAASSYNLRGFGTLAAWRITQRGVAMVQCPQHCANIVGMPHRRDQNQSFHRCLGFRYFMLGFRKLRDAGPSILDVTSWRPRAGEQDRRRSKSKALPVAVSLRAGLRLTGAPSPLLRSMAPPRKVLRWGGARDQSVNFRRQTH